MSKNYSCIWCGSQLDVERSSKKVCSPSCQQAYYRWRDAEHLSNSVAFIVLDAIVRFNGEHPNANYRK